MSEVAHVPESHQTRRVDGLKPDEIAFTFNMYQTPQGDELPITSYDPETKEVFLYKDALLEPSSFKKESVMGRIGIMRAAIFDNGMVVEGYVVDLRQFEGVLEPTEYTTKFAPDSVEEENYWRLDIERRLSILAITSNLDIDSDGAQKYRLEGNPIAFDALRFLVSQADIFAKEAKEKDESETDNEINPPTLLDRIKNSFKKVPSNPSNN